MKFKLAISSLLILFITLSCTNDTKNPKEAVVSSIGSGDDVIKVVVVSGTPYEMGYQLGKALKDDIRNCMTGFLKFGAIGDPERFNPKVLDDAWTSVEPYIHTRFKEELKGLAAGS